MNEKKGEEGKGTGLDIYGRYVTVSARPGRGPALLLLYAWVHVDAWKREEEKDAAGNVRLVEVAVGHVVSPANEQPVCPWLFEGLDGMRATVRRQDVSTMQPCQCPEAS